MQTFFIADLHLQPAEERTAQIFFDFLGYEATEAEALYILGDLFMAWPGDDDRSPFNEKVKGALRKLVQKGTRVFLMPGNRDFLLGDSFAEESGCTLLTDPTIIDLYGRRTLLTHGDNLCGRDILLTSFRGIMGRKRIRKFFLSLPLVVRKSLALAAHGVSSVRGLLLSRKHLKSIVYQEGLQAMLANDLTQLIHGHIHIPFIDEPSVNNTKFRHIVLAAWQDVGSVLIYRENGQCDFVWID